MPARPGGRPTPGARPGGVRGAPTGSAAMGPGASGASNNSSASDTSGTGTSGTSGTSDPGGESPREFPSAGLPNLAASATTPVLAVLEDCAAGALLIECSAALARALGRDLAVVQVQSTLALQAAALPLTQVLAHAGAPWAPYAPQDVERGWRAQAARLQALATPIATRHALRWSLRSVRGELGAVARGLLDETDLLFLGARAWQAHPAHGGTLATPGLLVVLNDGSDAARRALRLAADMAANMAATTTAAWRVQELPAFEPGAIDTLLQRRPAPDALVMPRSLATRERWTRLSRLGCPVLLIG